MSDSAIPWTVARQASLLVGFSRQEYWSGYWSTLPPPGHLPDPGIKSVSLMFSVLVGRFFTTSTACLQRTPIHTRLQLQLASQAPQCLLWSSKPQSPVVVNHCQHTYLLYTTSRGVSRGEVSTEPAETKLKQLQHPAANWTHWDLGFFIRYPSHLDFIIQKLTSGKTLANLRQGTGGEKLINLLSFLPWQTLK